MSTPASLYVIGIRRTVYHKSMLGRDERAGPRSGREKRRAKATIDRAGPRSGREKRRAKATIDRAGPRSGREKRRAKAAIDRAGPRSGREKRRAKATIDRAGPRATMTAPVIDVVVPTRDHAASLGALLHD